MRFNLSNTKAGDLAVDAVGRIYLAGETTKWDGRGQLYGFLNGRIAKRILDAVRKNPEYLENIDSNQFDSSRPIQSIFFGGGTPSLFNPQSFKKII